MGEIGKLFPNLIFPIDANMACLTLLAGLNSNFPNLRGRSMKAEGCNELQQPQIMSWGD